MLEMPEVAPGNVLEGIKVKELTDYDTSSYSSDAAV